MLGCLPQEVFEYTKRVVADAFFSKRNFVDGLTKMGLKVISCFRDDAALYYLYKGPKTGLPGAPKKYDGKVDVDRLNMKVFFKLDYNFDGGECFCGTVYSKALKQKVKVVVWFSKDKSKHKIFFSNDLTLAGTDIVKINCLKMAATQSGIPYSISNLKMLAHGQYLMNRFIRVSGISADSGLIAKLNKEVFSLTTMQYDAAA